MSDTAKTGRILKGIGGFYYVEAGGAVYECKARGIFRKDDIRPVAGDYVRIAVNGDGQTGVIDEMLPRKNYLIRPPIANIDRMLFIVSTTEPVPNTLVLDKLLAVAEYKEIEQIIVLTKIDLQRLGQLQEVYERAGFPVYVADYEDPQSLSRIGDACAGGLCVFCGNSGVGKSTLINALDNSLDITTGEISQKLGRGRHTTRSVELYPQEGGGYIADSPGFSSLETERLETIYKERLQYCFREFAPYLDRCRFKDCSHTVEQGCAVIQAVGRGEIPESRHESYVKMYEEAKGLKEWEREETKRKKNH